MRTCIICRKEKSENEFNDEHVIPDAVGGYYHIRKVCIVCNGHLGTKIDHLLTNHKFMEFQRQLSTLKGKKGAVPDALAGLHHLKDEPDKKVMLKIGKDGAYKPEIVTQVFKDKTDPSKFTIMMDQSKEKELDKVLDKHLSRNGLKREQIKSTVIRSSDHPWIQASMSVDLREFKLGLLKIAYEFTVDQLPDYLNDPMSLIIAGLLLRPDAIKMEKEVVMLGNGLNHEILKPFELFLDFSTHNHYLILKSIKGVGLMCFVRLFSTFSIAFRMSLNDVSVPGEMVIGKNDILGKTFEVRNINDIIDGLFGPTEQTFNFWFPDQSALEEFQKATEDPDFRFFTNNGQLPLYDAAGAVRYADVDSKLAQPHIVTIPECDESEEMSDHILDELLYIRVLPSGNLVAVTAVRRIRPRKGKF